MAFNPSIPISMDIDVPSHSSVPQTPVVPSDEEIDSIKRAITSAQEAVALAKRNLKFAEDKRNDAHTIYQNLLKTWIQAGTPTDGSLRVDMAEAKVATAEARFMAAGIDLLLTERAVDGAIARLKDKEILELQSHLAQLQRTHRDLASYHILDFTLPHLASWSSSTTTAKVPDEAPISINEKVHLWEEFPDILQGFRCPEMTTADPPPTFDVPAFSEGGLYLHIFNLFRWAKPCLAPKEHSLNIDNMPPKSKKEVRRNYCPDIIICDGHVIPYFVGEVKMDAIIPADTNFTIIDASTLAFRALAQSVNYLKNFKCTYGVLTTFNCWWFIKLDGSKVLVSEGIRDDTKRPRVILALAAVLNLARESKTEQEAKKDLDLEVKADAGGSEHYVNLSNAKDSRSGGNGGEAPLLGELDASSGDPQTSIDRATSNADIEKEGFWLGDGRHGGVFLEVVDVVRVAFKSADSENRKDCANAIFREKKGTDVAPEGWKQDLTQDDLELALVSLSAIQEKEYIHRDVRHHNLVFHRDSRGRRAFWIDRESCKPGTAEMMEEEKERVRKNRFDP
ncbi:hypothetical protein HDU97_009305 [Phlyctochytrium planicorne]|nr:hypothetical protein HDU97_009305 [Phlyctochytrium planicorne]